jgi:hypothetical protein
MKLEKDNKKFEIFSIISIDKILQIDYIKHEFEMEDIYKCLRII